MATIANYIAPVGNYLARQFPTPLTKVAAAVVIGSALNALKNFTRYMTGFGQKSGLKDREIQVLDEEIERLTNLATRSEAQRRAERRRDLNGIEILIGINERRKSQACDENEIQALEKEITELRGIAARIAEEIELPQDRFGIQDKINEKIAFHTNVSPLFRIAIPALFAFATPAASSLALVIGTGVTIVPEAMRFAGRYSPLAKGVAAHLNSFHFAMHAAGASLGTLAGVTIADIFRKNANESIVLLEGFLNFLKEIQNRR